MVLNRPIKRAIVKSFTPQITASKIAKANKEKGTYDYGQVKRLTLANIAAARANAKDLKIVGIICIPDEGLNLPISKGITNRNLALSAGTLRPNMKMGKGNYALAGHNMSNLGPNQLFSPLYFKGKVGQKVYITDMYKVYEYRITERRLISKWDTGVIKNTQRKMITLITCDATGARRLMVRGKYVSETPYHQVPENLRKQLSKKYNQ